LQLIETRSYLSKHDNPIPIFIFTPPLNNENENSNNATIFLPLYRLF
jgi:hypothetical protein